MSTKLRRHHQSKQDLELRDRLIYELYIRLRAERETRDAIAEAAIAGASAQVIEALASDPVPPIDDFGQDDTVETLLRRLRGVGQPSVASVIDT